MKTLTDLYMITGTFSDEINFLNNLITCLERGICMFQFRAKHLTNTEYLKLANRIAPISRKYNAKFILNCPLTIFNLTKADGIQLTSFHLYQYKSRPINTNMILSASCHTKADIIQAKKLNVDFITLSPVKPTTSHPDAIPLGWEQFKELATLSNIPTFALGGLKKDDLATAKINGATGIAAISSLWYD